MKSGFLEFWLKDIYDELEKNKFEILLLLILKTKKFLYLFIYFPDSIKLFFED